MVLAKMKLKERVMISFCVVLILFTLFLVVDIQTDLGVTRHHLMPSHGQIKYDTANDGPGAAYNSFRRRFLQKGNGSKESAAASQQQDSVGSGSVVVAGSSSGSKPVPTTEKEETQPHDDFRQLYEFLRVKDPSGRKFARSGALEFANEVEIPRGPTLLQILGNQGR
ncbi:hypothetical protein RUM44_010646 [Polyplax serrata]|uniref:Uncharacterized protein n=1 Tax=Polyplax serrata TaxID=468196 RepID=A0ABR1AMR7_POLSC